MQSIIHYTSCPVCGSTDLREVFAVTDFTVSREQFTISECGQCTLRFTQDVPDETSIGPYYKSEDYISHTNTSKGLVNRLYQAVRKRTMKGKRQLIESATGIRQGQLLDVGSGVGSFVHTMQQAGWQVTGLEPEADARGVAKATYGIELHDMQAFYTLPPGSFDAITLWHVLEHVHDLEKYVQQLRQLLKPGGKLFIAVPNYTSRDATTYGPYWAAYDVPRHLYHFSPKSMQVLMEKNGLKVQRYVPMWYDSFYIALLSSRYKHGKSNLAGAFIQGMLSNMQTVGDKKKCSSVTYIISRS